MATKNIRQSLEKIFEGMERINSETYDKIEESSKKVNDFFEILNGFKVDEKLKGELKIAHDNLVNHDLLKTNALMLNYELMGSYPTYLEKNEEGIQLKTDYSRITHDPKKILILSESYLTKLGAIGSLTLEQVASSLIGKYDPFKPNKKVRFEEIKSTISQMYSGNLSESFLKGFLGISGEVRELRNKAAHSNLVEDILLKREFNPGSWDSNRIKDRIYSLKFDDKKHYGFVQGDLILNSSKGEFSLTEKLNEYSMKYLEMVKDLYEGLINYKKMFKIKL